MEEYEVVEELREKAKEKIIMNKAYYKLDLY